MTIKDQVKNCFTTDKRLGFSLVLASLYIGLALTLNFFSCVEDMKWYLIIAAVVFVLLVVTINAIGESSIGNRSELFRSNAGICATSFLIVLMGQLLYFAAYYPGGFNLDAYGQWDQIHGSAQWDNWHPILTTMIYWLITRIADSLGLCIFVQITLFSVSLALLMKALAEVGVSRGIIVVLDVAIAITPSIGMNNVCLVKDVYFTIGVILVSVIAIKMYMSDGEWINKWQNTLVTVLISAFIILVRHNSVIYVIPLYVMLLLRYRRNFKRIVVSMLSALLIAIAFETVIVGAMDVKKHSNLIGEVVGVPMAAMANAYVNNYDDTPLDVKQYYEAIAERENWNKLYVIGEWDSCKWDFGGIDLLQGEKITTIANMFFETTKACPQEVFLSIRENTRIVWQLIGRIDWVPWIYIEDNYYDIAEKSIPAAKAMVETIERISYHPVASFFIWNIGVKIIGLILVGILSVKNKEMKKNLLLVPLFCYVFGTMLLLSGPTHRYFYFVSVLTGPYIALILFGKEGSKVSNNEV